ncbi:DUF262 domain-containing protein [Sphingomonas sp. MMS12-HWE2-04]|uniref:DUF262 domain-containing protein n=1 Tax=Sphingomonas sp. MMS12-HWE2-04 TaxID=3234199 RepID=UPI00384E9D45
MQIFPSQVTIGALLETTGTFEVPKYQRNYAWHEEEVASFLNDLDLSLAARRDTKPRHHFFGGVVTAHSAVAGSTRQHHELVDGQQRLATFLMLVVQLKQMMRRLVGTIDQTETDIITFLNETADLLDSRFERQRDRINLQWMTVPRLQLSLPDHSFFEALLAGTNPPTERASHDLLQAAFEMIGLHLQTLEGQAPDATAKANLLENILKVLEEDWTVIHMAAQDRDDAYMLFQVLNDRGKSLTEGELLRATTLEAIAPIGIAAENAAMERQWDDILSGKELDIRQGLMWVYASQIGAWPGKSTLLSDLQAGLFPMTLPGEPLSRGQADALIQAVQSLSTDFATLRSIKRGDWPMQAHAATTAWDRDRLRLLVVHLKQTDCLPLLVAATLLTPQKFAEVAQALERFTFRYSVMVEGPKIEAAEVMNAQAVEIRRDPSAYRVGALIAELRRLIGLHAPDDVFGSQVAALRYLRAESNKPLKYLLMTLEHYVRWFDEGAQGRPACRDRMRVLDFENATIEHIYPENAEDQDPHLLPLLDTLGNLTILSPEENDKAGAKDFAAKRPYLKGSTSTLNNQIAEIDDWNAAAIQNRQARLVDMAKKVFAV